MSRGREDEQLENHGQQASTSTSTNGGAEPRDAMTRSTTTPLQSHRPATPTTANGEADDPEKGGTPPTPLIKEKTAVSLDLSSTLRHGAHRKEFKALPLLRRPRIVKEGEPGGGKWLEEEWEAQEWIDLFYDLAVVAVLTVFSSAHELSSPGVIPIFFSYFVLISWVWTSQVHYDIRFAANDTFHRLAKAVQISLFVYFGAASGNWDTGLIRDPNYIEGISSQDYTIHQGAAESFTTVAIAFAISRAVLGVQYLVSSFLGRKTGRRIRFQIVYLTALAISCAFVVVAVAVPAHTPGQVIVKNTFLYLSIIVELVALYLQMHHKLHRQVSTEKIAERYGALTLIILGEGFISVTRAFNRAISGLSDGNSATYLQVFLTIAILVFLWAFLFGRFDKNDAIDQRRALFWQALHFPLHFSLLLLLAALVNVTVVISYAHGVTSVSNAFLGTIEDIGSRTPISPQDRQDVESYLNKLTLWPSYETELELLQNLTDSSMPSDDPTLIAYQYFGQILVQTSISYGLDIEEEILEKLEELYAINTTWSADEGTRAENQQDALVLLEDIVNEPVNDALQGVLWLFPTAGAVLILCALRSMLWYRYAGPSHYVVHVPLIVLGTALALLGLLDIGPRRYDASAEYAKGGQARSDLTGLNPMYELLGKRLPLVIVAVVYALGYFGAAFFMGCIKRSQKRRGVQQRSESEDREKDAVSPRPTRGR